MAFERDHNRTARDARRDFETEELSYERKATHRTQNDVIDEDEFEDEFDFNIEER